MRFIEQSERTSRSEVSLHAFNYKPRASDLSAPATDDERAIKRRYFDHVADRVRVPLLTNESS